MTYFDLASYIVGILLKLFAWLNIGQSQMIILLVQLPRRVTEYFNLHHLEF